MRWDEHGWGNYGPAMLADIRAAVDADGKLTGLEYTGVRRAVLRRPAVAADRRAGPRRCRRGVGALNTAMSGEPYNIANRRVVAKDLPLENNYFKTRHLRAPLAPQTRSPRSR